MRKKIRRLVVEIISNWGYRSHSMRCQWRIERVVVSNEG